MTRRVVASTIGLLALPALALAGGGAGQAGAAVVVEVATEPPLSGVTLRFTGVPGGALVLSPDRPARLSAADPGSGTHTSTLGPLSPAIQAAGYGLAAIECDDGQSARVSTGDLASRTATFRVEEGESVKCVFRLVATERECLCPKEGRWRVQNHAGSMECSGTMSLSLPLAARGGEGDLEVGEDCTTFVASGMSDEAPVSATLNDSCGFEGTAGGEEGGMPLTIHFTFAVESEERMTGDLSATVSEQGTTCVMSRTFELDFAR